jgi:hypothetical protein
MADMYPTPDEELRAYAHGYIVDHEAENEVQHVTPIGCNVIWQDERTAQFVILQYDDICTTVAGPWNEIDEAVTWAHEHNYTVHGPYESPVLDAYMELHPCTQHN